ncbi:MAG: Phosphate transport system permease protein PstA, partial [Candidatus Poribacteria bacterium]|nr:Phosphate transport system permease protein PstA [Candidatus Poribacteria bacterium]
RIAKDIIFKGLIILFSVLSGILLIIILYFIVKNGISSINWEFIINLPKPVGEIGGGIANAIIGTLILIGISSILAIPMGIGAGIYLSENKQGRLPYIVRLCVEVLQGIPSIVIGIIAYAWIVIPMKSPSALSGGIALGIMMLPVIIRSTEETLKLIPNSLREASLALGVPYSRTIMKVIVPAGLSGIITGILLSVARITGETAPLLFTAFGGNFMNFNIFKPIASLPLVIFNYATSPYTEWISLAWGASFVLAVLILGLNLIAKLVARKWKVQF